MEKEVSDFPSCLKPKTWIKMFETTVLKRLIIRMKDSSPRESENGAGKLTVAQLAAWAVSRLVFRGRI